MEHCNKCNRVARLKAIGNGQVPICAAAAWEILATEQTNQKGVL